VLKKQSCHAGTISLNTCVHESMRSMHPIIAHSKRCTTHATQEI
jgi:hypothetical protein